MYNINQQLLKERRIANSYEKEVAIIMNLFMKLKIVFDTIVSFFQALNFIIEYVKKYFDNKKRRSSGKNQRRKFIIKSNIQRCDSPLFLSGLLQRKLQLPLFLLLNHRSSDKSQRRLIYTIILNNKLSVATCRSF